MRKVTVSPNTLEYIMKPLRDMSCIKAIELKAAGKQCFKLLIKTSDNEYQGYIKQSD